MSAPLRISVKNSCLPHGKRKSFSMLFFHIATPVPRCYASTFLLVFRLDYWKLFQNLWCLEEQERLFKVIHHNHHRHSIIQCSCDPNNVVLIFPYGLQLILLYVVQIVPICFAMSLSLFLIEEAWRQWRMWRELVNHVFFMKPVVKRAASLLLSGDWVFRDAHVRTGNKSIFCGDEIITFDCPSDALGFNGFFLSRHPRMHWRRRLTGRCSRTTILCRRPQRRSNIMIV